VFQYVQSKKHPKKSKRIAPYLHRSLRVNGALSSYQFKTGNIVEPGAIYRAGRIQEILRQR